MDDRSNRMGARATWLDRLGLAGAAAMVLALLLGSLRLAPGLPAFYLYALGGFVALGAGVGTLVQAVRGQGFPTGRTLGLLAGVVFAFTGLAGRGGPMTNDFTTDLDDPPGYEHIAGLGPNSGRDMSYDPSFAAEQQACCADLAPLEVSLPPARAFDVALATASAMGGWTVVWSDPASGRIEAVSVTPVFGFEDDITIRLRPSNAGSRIDMRSKSRDGRGDLGANAERIRQYLAAIGSAPSPE